MDVPTGADWSYAAGECGGQIHSRRCSLSPLGHGKCGCECECMSLYRDGMLLSVNHQTVFESMYDYLHMHSFHRRMLQWIII